MWLVFASRVTTGAVRRSCSVASLNSMRAELTPVLEAASKEGNRASKHCPVGMIRLRVSQRPWWPGHPLEQIMTFK